MRNLRIQTKPVKLTNDFHWTEDDDFDFYFQFWGWSKKRFKEKDEEVSSCFKRVKVKSPEVRKRLESIDWDSIIVQECVTTFIVSEIRMSEIYADHIKGK